MSGRLASCVASVALGAALAAVAFGARGGTQLGRTTVAEILLILVCGLGLAAALAAARPPVAGESSSTAAPDRPRPLHGGATLALLGLLVVLTALSVTWSIAPDLSWVEANRVTAYFAVFAVALCAGRLLPRAWPVVLGGLVIGAGAVTAWALVSRVFPGELAADEVYARIGQPYDYWNAVGTTAAIAVVPTLWLGWRAEGGRWTRALAFPLASVVASALVLSYSRGALVAALAGAAIWIAVTPARGRSLAVLASGAIACLPVVVWATGRAAFTEDLVPIDVREAVASGFGVRLLVMVVVLYAAGLRLPALADRLAERSAGRERSPRARRRLRLGAVAVAVALVIGAVASVAASDRGLGGTLADRFESLTSEQASTPGGPERLTSTSSSRGRYWRQASDVFADHVAGGTGAGSFGIARLRYRKDELVARHAHGFVAQTMADLGLAGLLLVLALAGAWLVTAARATGLGPRRHEWRRSMRGEWTPERAGVVAIALAALVFGLHSTIDWTWFVPGPAVMALVAAGFVAGRGPLGEAVGSARLGRPDVPRALLGAAVLLIALLAIWSVWQPERAERKTDEALAQLEDGDVQGALASAHEAADIDPLALQPGFVLAAAQYTGGDLAGAHVTLQEVAKDHPADPRAWLRLGNFRLNVLGDPAGALEAYRATLFLDPRSQAAERAFLDALAAQRLVK